MKILLAMSGGVDSSTVAHLLKEDGHDVIAVRFNLWTDPLAPALAQVLPTKCCTTQNISRASRVCKKLQIPLHVVDLTKDFKKEVVDPFLSAHKKGLTPNPCIRCNKTMKFGKLYELMEKYGCDRLATGHYARIATEEVSDGSKRHLLLEAVDSSKDQSYYLYGLSQKQLSRVMFPLGGMKKKEVYALASRYGMELPVHYRESQDLCFFPEKTPQEFLKRHLADSLRPGPIMRRDGKVVGTHKGYPLYTVGQRKGLGIGGLKVPLEVVEKNADANTIVVAEKEREKTAFLGIKEMHWISWKPEENNEESFALRTRSLMPKIEGKLMIKGSKGIIRFARGIPLQAPGQSVVIYRGQEVLGGGVIERVGIHGIHKG